MKKETGGPAFPSAPEAWSEGMTLRDYFAAKVAGTCLDKTWDYCQLHKIQVDNVYVTSAAAAYELADAMLSERAKDGE